jgi:hypothetical protein
MTGLPDRLPVRVSESGENYLQDGAVRAVSGDDSYALDASSATRVDRAAVGRLSALLTDRERSILESVARFRYLTGRQIQLLHFFDHSTDVSAARTCRRVMERLIAGRLVQRAHRRIGGVRPGSSSFVYGLSELGHRLVYDDGRRRWHEPSDRFLDHTLAIADLAVALHQADRRGDVELVSYETEPANWRRFPTGLGGFDTLKPDLTLTLGDGDYEDRWFVEVDRGTASLRAVATKCATYIAYLRTGIEQRTHDAFPRVLWTTARSERAEKILSTIEDLRAQPKLFAVTSTEGFVRCLTPGGAS